MKKDIKSFTLTQLTDELTAMGEKAFRAKQIYEWLHVKLVDSFNEMTNLSKALREKLSENFVAQSIKILESIESKLDGTEKYLYELLDGNIIEGVRMRYHHGDTLCVSTQVGCRMGCAFCEAVFRQCRQHTPCGALRCGFLYYHGRESLGRQAPGCIPGARHPSLHSRR